MKKSEELKQEAQQEESYFAYMAKMNKSMREARLERFEDGYNEKLEINNCIVIPFNGSKIVIDTQTEKFGIVDYYPKANKILIRKDNKWITQGLRWINESLLKQFITSCEKWMKPQKDSRGSYDGLITPLGKQPTNFKFAQEISISDLYE